MQNLDKLIDPNMIFTNLLLASRPVCKLSSPRDIQSWLTTSWFVVELSGKRAHGCSELLATSWSVTDQLMIDKWTWTWQCQFISQLPWIMHFPAIIIFSVLFIIIILTLYSLFVLKVMLNLTNMVDTGTCGCSSSSERLRWARTGDWPHGFNPSCNAGTN